MFIRYSSVGTAAVDSVLRLGKLMVAYPLEILCFLWKPQVYGVFMTAIPQAK